MSLRHLLRFTAFGRVLLIPFRLVAVALPYALRQMWRVVDWSFQSKEYYNFTYDLQPLNKAYLGSFIAVVSGFEEKKTAQWIAELERDEDLRSLLIQRTIQSPDRHSCDAEPRYGRRLGWYALVRATKPRIVVETGVDRGLGTAVIAAALRRNAQEGYPGIVYATDINADCGHLITEPYKQYVKILIGDSVESLRAFKDPVDIFIHDSDHRAEYEWAEFLAIEPCLHPGSIVMSDNSNQTPKLLEFAQRIGKSFLYFHDQPKNHWWPGDGIGVAFVPGVKTVFPGNSGGDASARSKS